MLHLGVLKRKQELRAHARRLVDGFHPGRMFRPCVVSEIIGLCAGRQHQIVIRTGPSIDLHHSIGEVHSIDVTQIDLAVVLIANDFSNRRSDVARGKRCGRDLIEQRLKKMVVVAIDDDDVGVCASQGLGRLESTEATAHNHYPRSTFHARTLHAIARSR